MSNFTLPHKLSVRLLCGGAATLCGIPLVLHFGKSRIYTKQNCNVYKLTSTYLKTMHPHVAL
jgi:hypothetical protein